MSEDQPPVPAGILIDGSAVPAWAEQYKISLLKFHLQYMSEVIISTISQRIPTIIEHDFVLPLGSSMCQAIQDWRNGKVDERFYKK